MAKKKNTTSLPYDELASLLAVKPKKAILKGKTKILSHSKGGRTKSEFSLKAHSVRLNEADWLVLTDCAKLKKISTNALLRTLIHSYIIRH